MRLIDADALEEKSFKLQKYGNGRFLALGSVRTAPTIDAVPVVRCRDCRWFIPADKLHDDLKRKNIICAEGFCDNSLKFKDCEDFCSYGERKDGEGNG